MKCSFLEFDTKKYNIILKRPGFSYLDLDPVNPDLPAITGRFSCIEFEECPFTVVSTAIPIFEKLEFQAEGKTIGARKYVVCQYCGIQNPLHNQYCFQCQQSLFKGRKLELDIKKEQRKKLIVKDKDKFIFCPQCGSPNSKTNRFCVLCMESFYDDSYESPAIDKKIKPSDIKYIFCPVCGGANQKGSEFCKDCMGKLG
ncbi:MAG: double zinc ribbon domain-containing protein [Vulcanimicrobiota bacterium]